MSPYAVRASPDRVTKARYSHTSHASASVMPAATAITSLRNSGACAAPASTTTAALRVPVLKKCMKSSNHQIRS